MSENEKKNPINEAFSPIASNFGQQIAPLGTDIGKTVNWAFDLVKSGINVGFIISNETWKYFREKLRVRLQRENIENITPPKMLIAGPTLEHLKYMSQDEEALQDMFVNLFASSMLKSSQSKAHPSFVEALKQMSSDEAKIIKHVYGITSHSFPCFAINSAKNKGFTTVQECFSTIGAESGCDKPNYANVYIKNLDRLGLLKHLPDVHFVDEGQYKELEETVALLGYEKEYETLNPGSKTVLRKGLVKLTEYGLMFCSVCVKE